MLKFNLKGYVILSGHTTDTKAIILDLLEASVTYQLSEEPVGYCAFQQALHDINVPFKFHIGGSNITGKWQNDKRAIGC